MVLDVGMLSDVSEPNNISGIYSTPHSNLNIRNWTSWIIMGNCYSESSFTHWIETKFNC